MLGAPRARTEIAIIRQQTSKPLNVNFFCHEPPESDPAREAAWQERLACYYEELGVDAPALKPAGGRSPFDEAMCEVVEATRPEVVSFHFGLPTPALLSRVRACGSRILSTATTVAEAEWLEANGCDAIIAQGYEAGGHRGMFLDDDIATQSGTLALVPQVVDAVKLPVIAAGGIADGRGIAAAFALGAAGVQLGTAYLLTPESLISELHRARLQSARDSHTALTNLFSGKPARGIMNRVMREVGPMSDQATAFPTAGGALAPLKAKAETLGDTGFSSLWSGQSASLSRRVNAGELTLQLAADAQQRLRDLGSAL
jgi:nitronate monooxygenase